VKDECTQCQEATRADQVPETRPPTASRTAPELRIAVVKGFNGEGRVGLGAGLETLDDPAQLAPPFEQRRLPAEAGEQIGAGSLCGLAPVTGEGGPKSDGFDDAGAHPIPCICDPGFVACQGREKWSVDAETGLLLLQHVGEDSV